MDAVNETPVSPVGALPVEGVQNLACNAQGPPQLNGLSARGVLSLTPASLSQKYSAW